MTTPGQKLEFAKVTTENGYAKVKCSSDTTIADICKAAVHTVSVVSSHEQFAVFISNNNGSGGPSSGGTVFCPELKWNNVKIAYPNAEFHLAVQLFPLHLEEAIRQDPATIYYLRDQIRREYQFRFPSIPNAKNEALEIGCLEIKEVLRRADVNINDKKSPLDYIEKSKGISSFFPPSVLDNIKSKTLRKSIQHYLTKWVNLTENDCVVEILKRYIILLDFDKHVFRCSLGGGWGINVDLHIGPRYQLSIRVENTSDVNQVARFASIQAILTDTSTLPSGTGGSKGGESAVRWHVKLMLGEGVDPLTFTFDKFQSADQVAHLINGYCRMGDHGRDTDFLVNGCSNRPRRSSSHEADNSFFSSDDYSDSTVSDNFQIRKGDVVLEKVLGEGQFGDVYKGVYKTRNEHLPVAVKTCKETGTDERAKFIDEAKMMQLFDHPHIVRLIGICTDVDVWIVMEYVPLGELRSYLIENQASLSSPTLVTYCYQISTAMAYLESKRFVHRDIAARNILISTTECVKLADFGMARWLQDDNCYTASNGKLPIKWMAPESYNHRKFSTASDVWMFAVCMWEILSLGVKPFHTVKNAEAVEMVKKGERMAKPDLCPPSLYRVMLDCWNYDPNKRPPFKLIKPKLNEICTEVKGLAASNNNMSAAPPKPGLAPSLSVDDLVNQSMPDLRSRVSHSPSRNQGTNSNSHARNVNSGLPPVSQDQGGVSSTSSRITRSTVIQPNHRSHLGPSHRPTMTSSQTAPTLSTTRSTSDSHQSATRRLRTSGTHRGISESTAEERTGSVDSLRHHSTATCPDIASSSPRNSHTSHFFSDVTAGGEELNTRSSKPSNSLPDLLQDDPTGTRVSRTSDPVDVILRRQQEQSQQDSNWLQQTERQMTTCVPSGVGDDNADNTSKKGSTIRSGLSGMSSQPRSPSSTSSDPSKPPDKDPVLQATTELIKAVASMSRQVFQMPPERYKDLIKFVGVALRSLLFAIQEDLGERASDDEVTLAERLLNADMMRLIKSAKVTENFASATFIDDYQRQLLAEAHSLAVDAKSLFDTVVKARRSISDHWTSEGGTGS